MAADEISDMISGLREEIVANVITEYIPAQSLEEQWDIAGLEQALLTEFNSSQPLRRWLGTKLDALEKRIATRGVIAIAIIRKVPVAPFTFVNMAIGALGIRYRDFILGTALGMLPGIAVFAFVSDRVIDAWREPTAYNIALIAGAIALWLGIVLGIQHWLNRRESR